MQRVWWSWDIRMKWAHGFSLTERSYVENYHRAIDSAAALGVDAFVIWGFLRDRHGGIDAARSICDHANEKGIAVLPGVGIDAYGGVYYDGDSEWSLDTYLRNHPNAQARRPDGTPFTFRHPKNDPTERLIGCPSDPGLMAFYRDSVAWLLETFTLGGFQVEQGDVGICHCDRCAQRSRTFNDAEADRACAEDMHHRVKPIIELAMEKQPGLTVILENYTGLLPDEIEAMEPFLLAFPDEVYHSWHAYTAGHHRNDFKAEFKITDQSRLATKHNCMSVRTNSDFTDGELDDRANITRAVSLARQIGVDMTYIYGEYPDTWPITKGNYHAWSRAAID